MHDLMSLWCDVYIIIVAILDSYIALSYPSIIMSYFGIIVSYIEIISYPFDAM